MSSKAAPPKPVPKPGTSLSYSNPFNFLLNDFILLPCSFNFSWRIFYSFR